ncbi:hypothetical protein ACIRVK_38900 [Streptomyces sp. NPDC101152]|uniref:hypothetical protein n=1 Tax=Streptomyces sp. NPDC101152 TaxID=3366116 RepID=UPI0037F27C4D
MPKQNADGVGHQRMMCPPKRARPSAPQAAWDFVATQGGGLELTTMLPVAVMGSVLGPRVSGANQVLQRLLNGQVPGLLNIYFPVVDVRDVAAAHVTAMTAPGAAGERFLLAADPALSMGEIAGILRARLDKAAARVPTDVIPDDAVRAGAATNPTLRSVKDELGYSRRFSTDKARRILRWDPHPSEDAVVAAGRSMVERGLVTVALSLSGSQHSGHSGPEGPSHDQSVRASA